MPSAWTLLWFGWGLYFLIVEGMALANSVKGDTLSEHVWAYLGLKDRRRYRLTRWAKLRRLAVVGWMATLAVHFAVGSDPLWNAVLIAASVVLGASVVAWWVVSRVWK